ncbi:hypothetical protein BC629DRAFT_1130146 [Irpex lacteus]|nr:hypothetical protein BC629DRAFT_1130146 [Irpex lacteus]
MNCGVYCYTIGSFIFPNHEPRSTSGNVPYIAGCCRLDREAPRKRDDSHNPYPHPGHPSSQARSYARHAVKWAHHYGQCSCEFLHCFCNLATPRHECERIEGQTWISVALKLGAGQLCCEHFVRARERPVKSNGNSNNLLPLVIRNGTTSGSNLH